ncbi:MAG: hypothetical protein K2Y30_01330 [Flavobacteriaceae bacterium]|nr:hypothetical protein [Flavobacteriaceae bacterium]
MIFLQKEWELVRSYIEFVKWISKNGMPDFISFDHDLADIHDITYHLSTDDEKSKEWQDPQLHIEKTGYDCAKWLVDYCLDNNYDCPKFYCHSMNPVGRDKINGLLEQFSNYR